MRAGNGYHADLHEIPPDAAGHGLDRRVRPGRHEPRPRTGGSAHGVVNDSVIQEIDIKTGLVMWEWHALGHIAAARLATTRCRAPAIRGTTSTSTRSTPGPTATCCCRSRNTWTLYDVDMHSGGVHWRIGGSSSSFKLGPGTRFYWQHDAEWQPGGLISVFDNGSDPPKEKQSRGLLLDPNPRRTRVTLVKQFVNPTHDAARLQPGQHCCSLARRQLADGLRRAAELHRVQRLRPRPARRDARARACRTSAPTSRPGAAQPDEPPALAVAAHGAGALTVAASWNGATEVGLLAGARGCLARRRWRAVATRRRAAAFRRRSPLPRAPATSRSQALNAPAR